MNQNSLMYGEYLEYPTLIYDMKDENQIMNLWHKTSTYNQARFVIESGLLNWSLNYLSDDFYRVIKSQIMSFTS